MIWAQRDAVHLWLVPAQLNLYLAPSSCLSTERQTNRHTDPNLDRSKQGVKAVARVETGNMPPYGALHWHVSGLLKPDIIPKNGRTKGLAFAVGPVSPPLRPVHKAHYGANSLHFAQRPRKQPVQINWNTACCQVSCVPEIWWQTLYLGWYTMWGHYELKKLRFWDVTDKWASNQVTGKKTADTQQIWGHGPSTSAVTSFP